MMTAVSHAWSEPPAYRRPSREGQRRPPASLRSGTLIMNSGMERPGTHDRPTSRSATAAGSSRPAAKTAISTRARDTWRGPARAQRLVEALEVAEARRRRVSGSTLRDQMHPERERRHPRMLMIYADRDAGTGVVLGTRRGQAGPEPLILSSREVLGAQIGSWRAGRARGTLCRNAVESARTGGRFGTEGWFWKLSHSRRGDVWKQLGLGPGPVTAMGTLCATPPGAARCAIGAHASS